MKFHGREGGCGSELEYHDSLHLPLLIHLLCCLENNQLGNMASHRFVSFVMIILLLRHLAEINFLSRFISDTLELLLSNKSHVSHEVVINVLQMNVVLLFDLSFSFSPVSIAKARSRSVIINGSN